MRVPWRCAWQRSRSAMGASEKATVNAGVSRSQVRVDPTQSSVQSVRMRVCMVQALMAIRRRRMFVGLPTQKTLLSTHLSAGAQAVAPNWDRYNTYQPGRPGVAAGADARRRKDKPVVVYRGEHGLPYVTDGVQVPPEDAFGSYEYDDQLAMVTMDASELVDANDLAEPALAGGPERPQVRRVVMCVVL
jgi:hypothetical protein